MPLNEPCWNEPGQNQMVAIWNGSGMNADVIVNPDDSNQELPMEVDELPFCANWQK